MPKSVKELADELGLSTATVSRALHGDPAVTAETASRVLTAAGDVGSVTRPRSRRRSADISATVGDTATIIAAQITNPIIVGFIDGLRQSLGQRGVRTVITLTDYNSEAEHDALSYAVASGGGRAGVFMLNAIETPRLISLLRTYPCPVVLINRYLRALDTDIVTVDNYRCGYLACEYLLRRHHRRIGHIAGPDTSITCRDRTRGYVDALRDAGITPEERLIYYGDRTWDAGAAYARTILSLPQASRPSAVFSTTGLMAAGMVDTLRRAGVRVPEDIGVIINDDYSKNYMPYPIDFTCYGQDPRLMGRTADELMAARVADPLSAPRRILLPPVLTEYNSVLTP